MRMLYVGVWWWGDDIFGDGVRRSPGRFELQPRGQESPPPPPTPYPQAQGPGLGYAFHLLKPLGRLKPLVDRDMCPCV